MKERQLSLEDLKIEERIISARLVGIHNEIKLRQPTNRDTIDWLQARHKIIMNQATSISSELKDRWKQEVKPK